MLQLRIREADTRRDSLALRSRWAISLRLPFFSGGQANRWPPPIRVASGMWLEFAWHDLRQNEVIRSSGEVNRLIDELGGQGLPSIDFAHIDLA